MRSTYWRAEASDRPALMLARASRNCCWVLCDPIWPARFPKDADQYGLKLAPEVARRLSANAALAGQPTDPDRFTDEDLRERELCYGRSGFALQFQLDASLSDANKYLLKLSDLIIHPLDPYRAPIDFMWRRAVSWCCSSPSWASKAIASTSPCTARLFHGPTKLSRPRRESCRAATLFGPA